MTTLREAAQQALEALEWISDCYVGDDDAGECASCHERSYKPHAPDCKKNNAITALRAALAQQAEPVEPVATLTAQRDALLEALKLARSVIGHPDDAHTQMIDATIKAVEGGA